ncbi:MAG: hypothetical protein Terrestrivirus1_49 [Terrestrivirus sp.]|uniref:TM2 domain-containing protein n=1 Tax=Terrestrivirus sp. TaxID=2487775 RepID=A0A3G4ZK18_9VIRU|nr:MAG: hypothetical protein Terrestrivirus1_49 [Terrestrivirus sp.]
MKLFLITLLCSFVAIAIAHPALEVQKKSGFFQALGDMIAGNFESEHDLRTRASSGFGSNIECSSGPSAEMCNYKGTCVNGNTCICDFGWITVDNQTTGCTYQQKTRVAGFLLHFFLGEFGAGEFYLGNTSIAAGQISLTLVGGFVVCILGCLFYACCKEIAVIPIVICVLAWIIGWLAWWIYECVFCFLFLFITQLIFKTKS